MRHVITLLVENEFGVLARISGLFSGRGFNIESLCVAETLDPSTSTMTIVTRGDDQIIEQVLKQLNKLVSVIKVVDLIDKDFVEREMVLIKVNATRENREEVLRVADIFRGKVEEARGGGPVLPLRHGFFRGRRIAIGALQQRPSR